MCPVLININPFKTNVPKDEHLPFPYEIYIYQKKNGQGFPLDKYLHLTYFS